MGVTQMSTIFVYLGFMPLSAMSYTELLSQEEVLHMNPTMKAYILWNLTTDDNYCQHTGEHTGD